MNTHNGGHVQEEETSDDHGNIVILIIKML